MLLVYEYMPNKSLDFFLFGMFDFRFLLLPISLSCLLEPVGLFFFPLSRKIKKSFARLGNADEHN
jgi:hypothetical protein